jgi:hypothetical protein
MLMRSPRILLRGDQVQARSLAQAHAERLLMNFRRGRSFQELQIASQEHNFLGPDGALVGSIRLVYAGGQEIVVITAPPSKPSRRELILKRLSEGAQFVPVFRSKDNRHFVVCLSGTFEPPYYVFENTTDTKAEKFLAENESELDGKLIATGTTPLGDSEAPSLIYVAQTGTVYDSGDVEYDESEVPDPDEIKSINQYNGDEWVVTDEVLSREPVCCSSIGKGTMHVDVDFERNYGYNVYATISGQRLSIPSESSTVSTHTWGTMGRSNWNKGSYSCEELEDAIEDAWVNGPYSLFGVGYDLGVNYQHADSTLDIGGELGVISMDAAQRSAQLYQLVTITTALEYEVVSDGECDVASQNTTLETQEWDTKNYFKVDDLEFLLPLYTPGALRFPEYVSDKEWVKYYGEESSAAITGMFSSIEFYPEPGVAIGDFTYGYVGPNNGNDITLTSFETIVGGHNLPGVDEEIQFDGDFFLGMILTASEEEMQVF